MKAVSAEQIGSALRGLAADLVAERRRVIVLERENRELRAQLEKPKPLSEEALRRARRALPESPE